MANEEYQLHESILQHMLNTDVDFFSSTLPRCQEYIDYCTTRDAASYKPVKTISRRVVHRDDLNERMTDMSYVLRKLNLRLDANLGMGEIERMIRDGISKRDLKALVSLSKKAAESENVELSEQDQQQAAEVLSDLTDEEEP